MTAAAPIIEVRTSPHVHSSRSVDMIMRNVIYALLPIAIYGVLLFGWSALALMATTTGTCVLAEHLYCRLLHRETSVNDYSAAITGLLLGMVLPPGLPLWMGVLGSLIAVLPGKMIFGGIGHNVFNPALVGRAFLQAAFPVAISAYYPALRCRSLLGIDALDAGRAADESGAGRLLRRDAACASQVRPPHSPIPGRCSSACTPARSARPACRSFWCAACT